MIEIKAKDLQQALKDYKACVYDKERGEDNYLYFAVHENMLVISGTYGIPTSEYHYASAFSLNEDIGIIKQDNNGSTNFYTQFNGVYSMFENIKLNDGNRACLEYDGNNLIIDIDGNNKASIPLYKCSCSINYEYNSAETKACIEDIDYDRFINFLKCYKETCKSQIVIEKFFVEVRDRIIHYVGTNNVALITMDGQIVNNDINITVELPYQVSKILTSLKHSIHTVDFIIKDKYFGIHYKNITMYAFNENLYGKMCNYAKLYESLHIEQTILLQGNVFSHIYSLIKDSKERLTNNSKIEMRTGNKCLNVVLYTDNCDDNKIETQITGNFEENFDYWCSILYFLDIVKFLKKKEYEDMLIKTIIYKIGYVEFRVQDIKLLVSDCRHV